MSDSESADRARGAQPSEPGGAWEEQEATSSGAVKFHRPPRLRVSEGGASILLELVNVGYSSLQVTFRLEFQGRRLDFEPTMVCLTAGVGTVTPVKLDLPANSGVGRNAKVEIRVVGPGGLVMAVSSTREPLRDVLMRKMPSGAILLVLAVVMIVGTGWEIARDWQAPGGDPDFNSGINWGTLVLVVASLLACFVAVRQMLRGAALRAAVTGVVAVMLLISFAGESFTIAEAAECDCDVSFRHGLAESTWIAFDTVPILKVNDALGWVEPQPIDDVRSSPSASDTPLRRWMPALLVRLAVGFVLLSLVKGLFDRAVSRQIPER